MRPENQRQSAGSNGIQMAKRSPAKNSNLAPTRGLSPVTPKPTVPAPPKTSFFVCYARADNQPPKRWLDRLLEHLSPLVRQENLAVWSDQGLKIGDEWDPESQRQLRVVKVAVLLVSPAFLASEYIANSELLVLLRRLATMGSRSFPCSCRQVSSTRRASNGPTQRAGPQEFALSSLQAAGVPSETLSEMTEAQQDRVFVALAERILEIIGGIP
jgi:TIR domain